MLRRPRAVWDRWFGGPLVKVEAESLAYHLSPAGRGVDWKTVAVVLTAAGSLVFHNYAGNPDRTTWLLGAIAEFVAGPEAESDVVATLRAWTADQATRLAWFALSALVAYVVIPVLVIKLFLREKLTDFGAGVSGVVADWPVYLTFAVVMLPVVYVVSGEPRFQDVYPFYRVASRADIGPRLLRWELVYALQFIGLEFFFRGFLVHGTKHRFGVYAVFLMVIPYCMIHFHKPLPETIGSIIAGVALGVVSLVTRSVWPGAALHILVAWTMDASVCIVVG